MASEAFEHLRNTVQRLGIAGKRPTFKQELQSKTLEQLLEMQEKYRKWAFLNPQHPLLEEKKHIYETYIVPLIEDKQLQSHVEELFV